MSARTSFPPAAPPRRTIATRILASFAVTLVAFAVTFGFAAVAQRRTAQESLVLAEGWVPMASSLGELNSVELTITYIVDEMIEERDPLSAREILTKTLPSVRRRRRARAWSTSGSSRPTTLRSSSCSR
jgi:hypothetical protein